MKSWITYCFAGLMTVVLFVASGCNKDEPAAVTGNTIGLKVYDDNSIKLPIQIVAGNGRLLSAYYTWDNTYRIMLTDNSGKYLWTKDFGITEVTGILAEMDGTYTIFENKRRINIDVAGNIITDDPDFLADIENYEIFHVMLNGKGNYFFYGANTEIIGSIHYAFAYEISHSGVSVFKKIFTANTIFTGCQLTSDEGYLFLGNQFLGNGQPTRFFLCKMNSNGVIEWQKLHSSPGTGIGSNSNYFYTHDIIDTSDGNYLCFVGSTDPELSSPARVYKVTPDGNLLDSVDINFAGKNVFAGGHENEPDLAVDGPNLNGYCMIKRSDDSYLVYMNNFGETNASYAVGGNQTFTLQIKDDLTIENMGYMQNIYSDYYTSVCLTSDGKSASFGYISSFGGLEKPVIVISE